MTVYLGNKADGEVDFCISVELYFRGRQFSQTDYGLISEMKMSEFSKYVKEVDYTMATSSITKEFVVKDEKAFKKMMQDINNRPERSIKISKPSETERRAELLLKQFRFR